MNVDPGPSATGAAEPASGPAQPRSRRALLAAGLGGLVGSIATTLGRPPATRASAGDPVLAGQENFAGASATRLSATSSGGAFWVTQYGFGSGIRAESVNGHGGVFTTSHQDRYGLSASYAGPADGIGVAIQADGGLHTGVHALSSAGHGVLAEVNGVNAAGVYGLANGSGGNGVYGVATADSTIASGVYGHAYYPSGYAGFFNGQVAVVGTLSKSAGTFRIDHPQDPANKILQHSFVESPEMKNVYDGLATTDAAGRATVELPAWFEALNRDFRYQLTPMGGWTEAWIEGEIQEQRFVIRTREPGHRISWQVTGIRRDAYAEAHPIEVEIDKQGADRGRYLNPVEHGQPPSKALGPSAPPR